MHIYLHASTNILMFTAYTLYELTRSLGLHHYTYAMPARRLAPGGVPSDFAPLSSLVRNLLLLSWSCTPVAMVKPSGTMLHTSTPEERAGSRETSRVV
ncbi:hypothetical protein AB205_0046860 [Aquarana catesbeiana]|uniref:Uncharacterized protein n=1 Tax=Aquarana catesbeiana TaxID=8400 RepID=A0A2G9RPD4_AQUCT|nr:hypothetical protein AB205_0046860 [Aquarana catesbeiana]